MPDDKAAAGSVFIKRVKKVSGGHHGGAWKIAYADFVTAMMAFFLLLWLLNSVTQEQLEGISNYFAPAAPSASNSGAGGVLGGQTVSADGAQMDNRSTPSTSLALPPPKSGLAQDDPQSAPESDNASEEAIKKKEEEQFEQAKDELRQAIQKIPNAAQLAKSLLVDNTPEGMRIQIVDQEGLPMFQSGSAEPLPRARELLKTVADVISTMPQKIAISGHTDSVKFGGGGPYTNWELSADRATATRRILLEFGVPTERIDRVVGKADTEPLLKEDPANPRNRRLSVVLLRQENDASNAQQLGNRGSGGAGSNEPRRSLFGPRR